MSQNENLQRLADELEVAFAYEGLDAKVFPDGVGGIDFQVAGKPVGDSQMEYEYGQEHHDQLVWFPFYRSDDWSEAHVTGRDGWSTTLDADIETKRGRAKLIKEMWPYVYGSELKMNPTGKNFASLGKWKLHPDNPTSYLKSDDKPIVTAVLTAGYGIVRVYEDPKYGDEVPLVVIDKNGNEVPNDYYDTEDIPTLHPSYADEKKQAAYMARSAHSPLENGGRKDTRKTETLYLVHIHEDLMLNGARRPAAVFGLANTKRKAIEKFDKIAQPHQLSHDSNPDVMVFKITFNPDVGEAWIEETPK